MGIVWAVILTILKILGLIFLSIIAILLFAIILILFVPVRYSFDAKYQSGDYEVNVKVNWFFKIVLFSYKLSNEIKHEIKTKIFGIDLGEKKDKKAKAKRKKKRKRKQNKNKAGQKINISTCENETESLVALDNDEVILLESDDNIEFESVQLDESFADDGKSDEIKDVSDIVVEEREEETKGEYKKQEDNYHETKNNKKESKQDKKVNKDDKQNDGKSDEKYGKINKYLEIIKSDEFKKSFELCKKKLIKLLKAVFPKHFNAKLDLAFTDPIMYGRAMAAYGMFFALLYKNVEFYCDGDDDYINIYARGKGRIYFVTALVIAINIYFNKNIRKLIKMLKVEE